MVQFTFATRQEILNIDAKTYRERPIKFHYLSPKFARCNQDLVDKLTFGNYTIQQKLKAKDIIRAQIEQAPAPSTKH